MRARFAGLALLFVANAALLYGAAGYLQDGSRLPLLLAGAAVSAACILLLARPT